MKYPGKVEGCHVNDIRKIVDKIATSVVKCQYHDNIVLNKVKTSNASDPSLFQFIVLFV